MVDDVPELNSFINDSKINTLSVTDITDEIKEKFLLYASYVIKERAIPDLKDGLKPSQRRVLWAMYDMGLFPSKPHKKSMGVTGECSGKYHPHGTTYPTLAKMAQDFSYNHILIDGQGNFGSIDNDPPAAERYTEARLSQLSYEGFFDEIDKDTVDFVPNFTEELEEPKVLPSRFPNLLVNGSQGIAVGLYTNIIPHNLGEVIDGLLLLLNSDLSSKTIKLEDVLECILAPDLPMGGTIEYDKDLFYDIYKNGHGSFRVRANYSFEKVNGKLAIIFNALPWQVNKSQMVSKISELVKDKSNGIKAVRDESTQEGVRVVIEVTNQPLDVVVSRLYKNKIYGLEGRYNFNFVCLIDGKPKQIGLLDFLKEFIKFRKKVVKRSVIYKKSKSEKRLEIIKGLEFVYDKVDKVIKVIKKSKNVKKDLKDNFGNLTNNQIEAIVAMRLGSLSSLEKDKLEEESKKHNNIINDCKKILNSKKELVKYIIEDLEYIKKKFAVPRKTELGGRFRDVDIKDTIIDENVVVLFNNDQTVKVVPVDNYRLQKIRRGIGVTDYKSGSSITTYIAKATTKDKLIIITDKGNCYLFNVFNIPSSSRLLASRHISKYIEKWDDENIVSVIVLNKEVEKKQLLVVTDDNRAKRILIENIFKTRNHSSIIKYDSDVRAVGAVACDEDDHMFLMTKNQYCRRIPVNLVPLKKHAGFKKVRGKKIYRSNKDKDEIISVDIVKSGDCVLSITEKAFGKRTLETEYPLHTSSLGSGIRISKPSKKGGKIIWSGLSKTDSQVLIITNKNKVVRISSDEIKQSGRKTSGLKLKSIDKNEIVTAVAIIPNLE